MNAIAAASIERDKALAWLDDLAARDLRGLFTGTVLLYMVAGTRP